MAKKKNNRPNTGSGNAALIQGHLGRCSSGAAGAHGVRSNRTNRRADKQALRAGRWD